MAIKVGGITIVDDNRISSNTRSKVQIISTNTTAEPTNEYVLTASLTLTLPSTPTSGDPVTFFNKSGTVTCVIARNGQNIMGLAEDMTIDDIKYFGTLVYADATRGWIFK
jgi:hypothetical protein